MENQQPEALRLAEWCEENSPSIYRQSAETAKELRRLHARVQELEAILESVGAGGVSAQRVTQGKDHIAQPIQRAAAPVVLPEPIGTVGAAPGTSGFTLTVFEAARVPVGTNIYTEQQVRELLDKAACTKSQTTAPEPFGYFKAEPFGWRDCAETDEGAVANSSGRFTKKPVTIDAIQWTGRNLREVIAFTDGPPETRTIHAGMAWDAYNDLVERDGLKIYTLEGKMLANVGDWIIRGVKGEYYPCKPDIFEATYSAAPQPQADARDAELVAAVIYESTEAMNSSMESPSFDGTIILESHHAASLSLALDELEQHRAAIAAAQKDNP